VLQNIQESFILLDLLLVQVFALCIQWSNINGIETAELALQWLYDTMRSKQNPSQANSNKMPYNTIFDSQQTKKHCSN